MADAYRRIGHAYDERTRAARAAPSATVPAVIERLALHMFASNALHWGAPSIRNGDLAWLCAPACLQTSDTETAL